MKPTARRTCGPTIILAGVLLIALLLAACGLDDSQSSDTAEPTAAASRDIPFDGRAAELPTGYPEPEGGDLTIGYVEPIASSEIIQAQVKALEAVTEQLGGTLITMDSKGDPDLQVTQTLQLISRDVDAIAVYPLDVNALDPVLERARRAGIPVIGVNVAADGSEPGDLWTSQIIYGHDYAAYLQARETAKRLPPGSEVVLIGYPVPVPALDYFQERQRHWLDRFGLEVVGDADNDVSDSIESGAEAMTGLLGRHPDLEAVLAFNETSAAGAAAAARAAGRRDLPIMAIAGGNLGFSSVRDGRITATVKFQAVEIGRQLAYGLYDAANGVDVPPAVTTSEPALVTQETVDEVPTWEASLEQLQQDGAR